MDEKKIRFIDSQYNELFTIPDGGSIVVTIPDGGQYIGVCKYLDETHFEINGSRCHIQQFAETLEDNDSKVVPEKEPEMVENYRIIRRIPVGDKVYVMGYSPTSPQPYVTWQAHRNIPGKEWGHYWSNYLKANTDLICRADAERTGIPYDHTKENKQKAFMMQYAEPFILCKLIPVPSQEHSLFFSQDTEPERLGIIGHLRADFDSGTSFFITWFEKQPHLKTDSFRAEFNLILNSLRHNIEAPVLRSRADMNKYCYAHSEQRINGVSRELSAGFKIVTDSYSYYFRCVPCKGEYDLYCYAYDNNYLLPELAGQHELPNDCYSVLPSTGELIRIERGEKGHFVCDTAGLDPEQARCKADEINGLRGISRAQEKAMFAASLSSWDVPAAKPWNYDENGNPRSSQPQKNEAER